MLKILFFIVLGFLLLIVGANFVAMRTMKKLKGKTVPEIGVKAEKAYPSLYYFFSPTCGPCKVMSPNIEKLEKEHPNVFRIDITREMATARKFGIMGVPATVVVDPKGTVKEVLIGVKTVQMLTNLLKQAS